MDNDNEIGIAQNQDVLLADSMRERIKKHKGLVVETDLTFYYKNLDFIYGSVVEVEQLWSIVKHALTNSRLRLTEAMFEALSYLIIKFNSIPKNRF